MVWILVEEEIRYRSFHLILSVIAICILLILYYHLVFVYEVPILRIIVTDKKAIDNSYDINDHYLLYDCIDINYFGRDYSLIYTDIPSYGIDGRNIENDYEIIVSDRYRKHLNKYVYIKINGDIYKFLVVGTFDSNNLINDKYIYTSKSTLDKLHNKYNFDVYNYIFFVEGYTDLNRSIDILRMNGYSSSVISNSYSTLIYNYTAAKEGILLFVWLLLAVIIFLLLC